MGFPLPPSEGLSSEAVYCFLVLSLVFGVSVAAGVFLPPAAGGVWSVLSVFCLLPLVAGLSSPAAGLFTPAAGLLSPVAVLVPPAAGLLPLSADLFPPVAGLFLPPSAGFLPPSTVGAF